MGCFSGCLMTSASDQKLFCEVCSAFSYSFDEFVGEKVVSSSYSSAILAPPLYLNFLSYNFFKFTDELYKTFVGIFRILDSKKSN